MNIQKINQYRIKITSKAPAYYFDPVAPLHTKHEVVYITFVITQRCDKNFEEFSSAIEARETFDYLCNRENNLIDKTWGYISMSLWIGNRKIAHWRNL